MELIDRKRRRAEPAIEVVPQESLRAVQPRLHRLLIDLEALGRLRGRQAFDLAHHEHQSPATLRIQACNLHRPHRMRNGEVVSSTATRRRTALLLVDVINDMDFEGSDALVRFAEPMARRLQVLKRRARAAGLPTIYINDNFGMWRSDFRTLVEHCVNDPVPGREVARLLKPDEEDYFVLKPKQSAFYGTTLETLLRNLGTTAVILTGIAADNCVLFSANDAYMRDLRLFIPSDCVASNTEDENRRALQLMAKVVKADIRPSTELDLDRLP